MKVINLHQKIPENKTSQYLLPAINVKNLTITHLHEFGYINSYISYQDNYYYKNCLYLLMNPSNSKLAKWYEFYKFYTGEAGYMDCIDLDRNVVVIIFELKKKYWQFPEFLMNGCYSCLGKEYSREFLIIKSGKQFPEKQWYVINRESNYRMGLELKYNIQLDEESELDDIPYKENEILDWDKIIEKYG